MISLVKTLSAANTRPYAPHSRYVSPGFGEQFKGSPFDYGAQVADASCLKRLTPGGPTVVPRTVRPAQYLGVPVTETRDDTVTWLTQEAYDRLKAELDHLSGPGRVDIAKKIEAARDEGDLRENGGYHAAKDEQGQIEARIILLQHILENARVGGPPRTDGVVGPGMTVTIRFVKDDDEVTFLLASREESGSPIDVYSPRSPLGAAIMGKKAGEKATYSLPNGRASTVEILEAVPYVGA